MLETLSLAVLIGLAGYRIVRLHIKDTLFDRWRMWLQRRRLPTKVHTGLMCPWCVSAYVTGAMVLVVWWLQPIALPFLVWLTAWTVAAVTYRFTDPD